MKERKPTIAFFGSSMVSAYRNGAATYFRGIVKYLFKQGYYVTFFEPDAFERQQYRDISDPFWAEIVVYQNKKQGVEQALEHASAADVLIKASGVGVFDDYLEAALPAIKQPHQTIIFWDVDPVTTLSKMPGDGNSPLRKVLPKYDIVLTNGGGDQITSLYRSAGARECVIIYSAFDPEAHNSVLTGNRFLCDLAFIGNHSPDNETRVVDYFVKTAIAMKDKKFILGGSGWENIQLPDNVRYINHLYTNDQNALYSSAMAVLYLSRNGSSDPGFSPDPALFEAAGAGACIITDPWIGTEQFLIPGEEIIVAENEKDMTDILGKMTTGEALNTGQAARRKVLSHHTYQRRVQQLDSVIMKQRMLIREYI